MNRNTGGWLPPRRIKAHSIHLSLPGVRTQFIGGEVVPTLRILPTSQSLPRMAIKWDVWFDLGVGIEFPNPMSVTTLPPISQRRERFFVKK